MWPASEGAQSRMAMRNPGSMRQEMPSDLRRRVVRSTPSSMSLNFDLQTETEGTSALVKIRGDLDLQVVEEVTEALAGIEAGEPQLLVIDLSGLSFMDSSGMGVVAAASIRA